ncbi:hypothetical protein SSPIM334S_06279 [Streptomyces spiroverticillatus]
MNPVPALNQRHFAFENPPVVLGSAWHLIDAVRTLPGTSSRRSPGWSA